MGERNDLIERRWIGVVPSGLQGPAKVTRLERVAEIWRNQGLFVTEWVPATTIASLSEALAEAEKKGAEDWQPIETAPKDGTPLDLWSSEFGRHTDCHWGKPQHCCGEAGQYCDSDWHTEPEGWVDGVLNVILSDPEEFTHWRPLPAPPRDLSQGGQHG